LKSCMSEEGLQPKASDIKRKRRRKEEVDALMPRFSFQSKFGSLKAILSTFDVVCCDEKEETRDSVSIFERKRKRRDEKEFSSSSLRVLFEF
jgi:hypothetical protein